MKKFLAIALLATSPILTYAHDCNQKSDKSEEKTEDKGSKEEKGGCDKDEC